jgi:hypothetical protein
MLHRVAILLFHMVKSTKKHVTCRGRHVLDSTNSYSYPSKLKPKVQVADITLQDLVVLSSAGPTSLTTIHRRRFTTAPIHN